MRKIVAFALITLSLVSSQGLKAQNFYSWAEYGVSAGASQYFGDLNDHYGFKYVRPALGIFSRLHVNPYIAVRGSVNYTKVGYDDKFSDNIYNKKRNLNFRSDILEAAVQAEFNFVRFSTGELGSRFTPYLTGGIGVFYFNPYTIYNDHRYYLRPLGTEGQNAGFDKRRYHKFAMSFPIGAGFKYWIRPGLNFGFEIADHLTTTDYMDDVSTEYIGSQFFPTDPQNPNPAFVLQDRSVEINAADPLGREGKQRGNSSTKDQFMTFLVHLSFQLKVYKCPGYLTRGTDF
jgi:hypothetical protein